MREGDTSTLYSCVEEETEAQDSEITHQPASDEARIGIPEYPLGTTLPHVCVTVEKQKF